MSTELSEQEKNRLGKLLNDLEVSEMYLPEKCLPLVREFRQKYKDDAADMAKESEVFIEEFKNPYKVDENVLEELNKKILKVSDKRRKLPSKSLSTDPDPKRPWRLNTPAEQLLRIDSELRSHASKNSLEPTLPSDDISKLLVELKGEIEAEKEDKGNKSEEKESQGSEEEEQTGTKDSEFETKVTAGDAE